MQRRSRLYFERVAEPLNIQVKRKIISAGGLVGEDPSKLNDKLRLADDLLFDDRKYDQLCNLLKRLVFQQKPSATLKCADVSDCETVGDVIDLITKTLNS